MKKYILLSTILSSLAFGANAEECRTKITGGIDSQIGFVGNSSVDSNSQNTWPSNNNRNKAINHRAFVSALVEKDINDKTKAGAVLNIATNVAENKKYQHDDKNSSFIFFETHLGQFKLGRHTNSSATMFKSAITEKVAATSYGWEEYANLYPFNELNETEQYLDKFIAASLKPLIHGMPLLYNIGLDAQNYEKVTYTTPKFNGAQLSVSYGISGKTSTYSNDLTRNYTYELKDIMSIAATYDFVVKNNLKFVFSAYFDTAKSYQPDADLDFHKVKDYGASLMAHFDKFTFLVSYQDAGKSMLNKNLYKIVQGSKNHTYTLGVKYKIDDIHTASISYLNNVVGYKKANILNGLTKSKIVELGLSRRVDTNFEAYSTLTSFSINNNHSEIKNSGKAGIVGMKMLF